MIVAPDGLSLINKLQARFRDRSNTGMIIEDIKYLSRASSIVFSFTHVSRKCNQVAHVLAKSAGVLSESVLFDVPPDLILSKLYNERC